MSILIEPIINDKKHGAAVQAKLFKLGLTFTNLENNPSKEFVINNINFGSAEGKEIVNNCDEKSFIISSLNPSQSYSVDLGSYGDPSFGLVSISLNASHVNKEHGVVSLSQKDPYSNIISRLKPSTHTPGRWNDFFYVESTTENQQRSVNSIMLWLTTVLTFLATMQVFKLFESEISYLLDLLKDGSETSVSIFTVILSGLITALAFFTLSEKTK